jgi:hypothetical protein
MPELTIAGGPSGVADFIKNGGCYGIPSSPLPEINRFSRNWLTEAINSGSQMDSLIDQGFDSAIHTARLRHKFFRASCNYGVATFPNNTYRNMVSFDGHPQP